MTKATVIKTGIKCAQCPFSKDNGLGRDRLTCTLNNQVVRTNWEATPDCMDEIEGDRGSGRIDRLIKMLSTQYRIPGWSTIEQANFENGIKDGLLRNDCRKNAKEAYTTGYNVAINY